MLAPGETAVKLARDVELAAAVTLALTVMDMKPRVGTWR